MGNTQIQCEAKTTIQNVYDSDFVRRNPIEWHSGTTAVGPGTVHYSPLLALSLLHKWNHRKLLFVWGNSLLVFSCMEISCMKTTFYLSVLLLMDVWCIQFIMVTTVLRKVRTRVLTRRVCVCTFCVWYLPQNRNAGFRFVCIQFCYILAKSLCGGLHRTDPYGLTYLNA